MVYIILNKNTSQIKIGKSKNPNKRVKQLQTGSAGRLKLIAYWDCKDYFEKRIHRALSLWRSRYDGEWFDIKPNDAIDICTTMIGEPTHLVEF